MADYVEVKDPKELLSLARVLSKRLKSAAHHTETRTIGYPRGSFRARVHFFAGGGKNIFWWAGRSSHGTTVQNLFGHGIPSADDSLNIDVQFNVPVGTFSRRSGGAFLQHFPTGGIVLAHRGIVTLGHGRIEKKELFAEMAATVREADTGNKNSEFLLVGELDSPTLIQDLRNFSSELRRTVRAIKGDGENARSHTPLLRKRNAIAGRLRHYFDEFTGQRKIKARGAGIADCYHGDVVRALRDALDRFPRPLKNREIDLTGFKSGQALLFEVKTSTATQSIYTAVGQLSVHAPRVAQQIGGLPVIKVIVLPERPPAHLRKLLENDLGIRVLTFTRSVQGNMTIHGLAALG